MRCPLCNSKFGYVRLKTNKYICRSCGQESNLLTATQMAKNFMGLSKNE